MIDLKQLQRLSEHFRNLHVYTWPVHLTHIHRVSDRRDSSLSKRELVQIFGGRNAM